LLPRPPHTASTPPPILFFATLACVRPSPPRWSSAPDRPRSHHRLAVPCHPFPSTPITSLHPASGVGLRNLCQAPSIRPTASRHASARARRVPEHRPSVISPAHRSPNADARKPLTPHGWTTYADEPEGGCSSPARMMLPFTAAFSARDRSPRSWSTRSGIGKRSDERTLPGISLAPRSSSD
jgi:hypothetical protein